MRTSSGKIAQVQVYKRFLKKNVKNKKNGAKW